MKFVLCIEMGNEAMTTRSDVVEALRRVANRVEATGQESNVIYDLNGNKVGEWSFEGELGE